MGSIIIIAFIVIYSGFVILKKIKDIKAGKFCSCGCENCPSKSSCHSPNDTSKTKNI